MKLETTADDDGRFLFELFYETGGHGGPHIGLSAAQKAACRHMDGCRAETAVYIRPYKAGAPDGFGGAVAAYGRDRRGRIVRIH